MSTAYWQEVMDKLDTTVTRMIEQIGGKFDGIGSDWWTSGF